MKRLYIMSFVAALLMLVGCGKENPFNGPETGEGQLLKSALAVDISSEELIRTRGVEAGTRSNTLMEDFMVIFTKKGETQPTAKYKYSEMPDVVTLPAGIYTCTAIFGELYPVAWEAPYIKGTSEEFEVKAMEITSYIDPILCSLENIKVTVEFDPSLVLRMSEDAYVDVKVGATDVLRFTLAEAESGKAGYFMHSDECTLVATFNGKVDNNFTSETKSLKNVTKGCEYRLIFKPHPGSDPNLGGDIQTDFRVEATVQIINLNRDVDGIEEDVLDDDERPKEGNDDDPQNPDDPTEGPTITADDPIVLDQENIATNGMKVVLHINSKAENGFEEFTCDIVSELLSPEELEGVGLMPHLDLVNTPEDLQEGLTNLGFPVNVGGQKSVNFDLTKFVPMMSALEPKPAVHKFVLKVKDANGTTEKSLILKFN